MKNLLYHMLTYFDSGLVTEVTLLKYYNNIGFEYFLPTCLKMLSISIKLNHFVSGIFKNKLEILHHFILNRYFKDLGEVAG